MKLGMTLKYYIKNSLFGVIAISIFFYSWVKEPDGERTFLLLLAAIVNSLLLPFSKRICEKTALLFSREEFWQREFFTAPSGRNLIIILEVFCFIFSVPICILFLMVKIVKTLSK